jgi:hypothetical protein
MEILDDVWEELIAEAARNPQVIVREGLADFLAVKTANDAIRAAAVGQLLKTMTGAVEHANRKGLAIAVETAENHRFKIEKMTLAGSLVRFRLGVRCLTVEAGWTRTPADGFMRGNALAVARLTHFGIAKANAELHLLKFDEEPQWYLVGNERVRTPFGVEELIGHLQIFLGIGA